MGTEGNFIKGLRYGCAISFLFWISLYIVMKIVFS